MVLDLLGQKPRDEGLEAAEDAGGHCWVGSGFRGPRQAKKGFQRPTQGLEYSFLICRQLPAFSPFPSPTSQMQNDESFCCWAANKNIMSAFQHLLVPACHHLGLGICQSLGSSLQLGWPGCPGREPLHVCWWVPRAWCDPTWLVCPGLAAVSSLWDPGLVTQP